MRLLRVPYRLLFPAILLFCCIGVFTINNNASDVCLAAFFGLLGYLLIKLGCEPAPLAPGPRARPDDGGHTCGARCS